MEILHLVKRTLTKSCLSSDFGQWASKNPHIFIMEKMESPVVVFFFFFFFLLLLLLLLLCAYSTCMLQGHA